MRAYTWRLHITSMRGLNVDKFKNRATGYRHKFCERNAHCRRRCIVEGEGGDDDDGNNGAGHRCRQRRVHPLYLFGKLLLLSEHGLLFEWGGYNGMEKGGNQKNRLDRRSISLGGRYLK